MDKLKGQFRILLAVIVATYLFGLVEVCSAAAIPLSPSDVAGRVLYRIEPSGITAFECKADGTASLSRSIGSKTYNSTAKWQISKNGVLVFNYGMGVNLIGVTSKDPTGQFWNVITELSEKSKQGTRVYFSLASAEAYIKAAVPK